MRYKLRFHPAVAADLDAITRWIIDYAGPQSAARRLAEIEDAIAAQKETPHKGSLREEITPGLRAIPAGRKAFIAFTVDDDWCEVFFLAVTYAGVDWMARSRTRKR